MRKVELGTTGTMVSELCLGTMTWGNRNTEAEGHAQIDMALDHGVNFIDTAEVYPVSPVLPETAGRTEEIVGTWLARSGRRDQVILATKIGGKGNLGWRDGAPITPQTIREALEGSLRRLRTDHVDLYQFHWPNRGHYHFRKMWDFDATKQPAKAEIEADMIACLETLKDLVREGKIRWFGASNDSAWGMSEWIRLAAAGHGPRPVSVQNEYSLMYRIHDTDMAELTVHEKVTLLAYSPLATGMLSGKYSGGQVPAQSRMSRTPDLGGRVSDRALAVADRYVALAQAAGIDPVTMAVGWILTRPFPVVPIVGATSTAQLAKSLDAAHARLPADLLAQIEKVHREFPFPY